MVAMPLQLTVSATYLASVPLTGSATVCPKVAKFTLPATIRREALSAEVHWAFSNLAIILDAYTYKAQTRRIYLSGLRNQS